MRGADMRTYDIINAGPENRFMCDGRIVSNSGRGVQLQNLFKPSKDVSTLRERIVNAIRNNTLDVAGLITEYNAEVLAFNATNTDPKKERKPIKSMTLMAAVAGTIRASFSATPGYKLSVSDLAQIESRVLAALAGCQTMINAYAKGLDLYKDIMSFLLNKPYADITSAERANGKVIILGCFGAKTPVLTRRGWIPMTEVESTDYVFDGVDWVTHDGVVPQGQKNVILLNGIEVTPDHKFETEKDVWKEAWHLKENTKYNQQALDLAIGSLSNTSPTPATQSICVDALDVMKNIELISTLCMGGKPHPASPVQTLDLGKKQMGCTYASNSSPEMQLTDWQIAITRFFPDVVERAMGHIGTSDEASNA